MSLPKFWDLESRKKDSLVIIGGYFFENIFYLKKDLSHIHLFEKFVTDQFIFGWTIFVRNFHYF